MHELGKTLVVFGAVLIGIGLVVMFGNKIPFLGRLPGDLYIQKKHVTFYFPLATSLILSAILSVLFWFWSRR